MPGADRGSPGETAQSGQTQRRDRDFFSVARALRGYGVVLAFITLMYVAQVTLSLEPPWHKVLLLVLQGITLVLVLRTAHARSGVVWLTCWWFALSMVILLANALIPPTSGFTTARQTIGVLLLALGSALLALSPVFIIRDIAHHRIVTADTILGAICVYTLMGWCFALAYEIIGSLHSGSFFGRAAPVTHGDYLFFSFITLTTVGYGNLVPVDDLGRALAIVEAIFGQVFLVVIVARLVALWVIRPPP